VTVLIKQDDWRIRINGNEHGPPHAHMEFKDGFRCSVLIETQEVLAVWVRPPKRLKDALIWIKDHQNELLNEYRRLNP